MAFDLEAAFRLAGYALAHAAWSVEDGETLIPLALVEVDGSRELIRFEGLAGSPDFLIRSHLRGTLVGESMAAVVLDAKVTPEGGTRTDALMAEILGPTAVPRATVVQPYVRGRRRFGVVGTRHGIRLLDPGIGGVPLDRVDACQAELLKGARAHPEGPRLFARSTEDAGFSPQ